MAAELDEGAADPDSATRERQSTGFRRRAAALTVGVIMLGLIAAGLAWAWHWRTHPDVFPAGGGAAIVTPVEGPGRTLYLGLTNPASGEGETVTIESVVPRIVENTAEATFETYLCTLDRNGTDNDIYGLAHPRLFRQTCRDPVRVTAGSRLRTGAGHPQQLVMGITVHQPGTFLVRGADVTYTHGWQRGTQAVGLDLEIRYR